MKNQKDLEKAYEFFESIKSRLIKEEKEGQFALIKGDTLIDVFHSEMGAYNEAVRRFGTELFLIQKIESEEKPESIQFLLHV